MGLMDFLKSGKVEEVTKAPRTGATGARKERNPNPALLAIRLFYSGAVYPSQALVEKFDLDYRKAKITKETLPLKDGQTEAIVRNKYEYPEGQGNGMDVIDTKEWGQFKGEGRMVFVAVVPKSEPKVDLFQSTMYEDDGTPKSTVMDQGAVTFGQQILLPMVKEVFGIDLGNEPGKQEFVDLEVLEEVTEGEETFNVTETFSKPIMLVPKRITRGKDKDKLDYERRENAKVYLLVPKVQEAKEEEVVDLTHATDAEKAAFLNS